MTSFATSRKNPKHIAIAHALSQKIASREWLPGAKLPTEAVMMEDFGVSRLTMRRALQTLMQDGLIVGHQGKGTYVNTSRAALALNVLFVHSNANGIKYPYTSLILDGIREFAQDRALLFRIEMIGMPELLQQSPSDTTIEELVSFGKCDGVIALPRIHPDAVGRLLQRGIPVVIIGEPHLQYPDGVIRVAMEPSPVIAMAFRHLGKMGRKTIGVIGTELPDRVYSYESISHEVCQLGMELPPTQFEVATWGINGGERAMERLLARNPGLDAVFASEDLQALGALHALWKRGVKVPEEIAVIGCGNMLGDYSHSGLSTIDMKLTRHGILAAELLHHRLEGKAVQPLHLLQPQFLDRATT
ncbi:MAG TPA: GntR family transcriptional regulator [Chthoniobacteraceae bacterium]|nr:GntR family transcriptional regulator [Chthoniobacteraceae bacterium]